MDSDIIGRIRYLIGLLKISQAEFARGIRLAPSNLSKHLSGKLPITDGLVNRIVVEYGVSKRWLRDGTDVPFARESHARELLLDPAVETPQPAVNLERRGAPVYDIDVTAGRSELTRLFTSDRITGFIDLPQVNPECPVVRVSGDSMLPVINNGGFVAIRPVSSKTIFWGQIYVVVTDDYRMVKYVRRHPQPDMVILHSANPQFDDIDLPRAELRQLFLVETIINYNILA